MSAALAWATVSARDASQHDLKAAALHAADMNRLSTHLRRRGHHMSVDTQKAVARALRYACKTACGPVSIERLNELSVQYLERPRTTRMTRNDVAHLVAAGIARRSHGRVEYCGKSKKHFVDLTVISGSAGQMENDFHAKRQQTDREPQQSQSDTKKTMVVLVPPPKGVRCRQQAASLQGVDLDAIDAELAGLSIVSPPLASTAFVEKEKKEIKGPSAAQPTTHCMADCPDGAWATLLNSHPARLAWRRYRAEQRRAARRTAACEVGGSGHVESAMGASWTTKRASDTTADANLCLIAGATSETISAQTCSDSSAHAMSAAKALSHANAPTSAKFAAQESKTPPASATATTMSFEATVVASRAATPSTASLTASPNTLEDELVDDETVPDEQLLSPATLETNASMVALLRPSHRRTSRLIALKRIREGKPAWETHEEASVDDTPIQRLSEAEARGFRVGSKGTEQVAPVGTASPPAKTPDAVAPLTLSPQPDDHLPADQTWLRWQLGAAPELARLAFRPEARGRYSRAVWRAAVGKLISRYRFQVQAPVPYLVAAAAKMAKPGCHDNRLSKFYSVATGWSPSLRKFAMVEARAPGWLRAYGGRDDWY